MTEVNLSNLPPARADLAARLVEIAGAEAALATLRTGRAKLALDIGDVKSDECALQSLVDNDARDIVKKLRAGVAWALDTIGGAKAEKLAAKLASSRHRAAVATTALDEVDSQIRAVEGSLAALEERKEAAIAAAMREAAEGLFEDYAVVLDELQAAVVHLAAFSRLFDTSGEWREGRVAIQVPNFSNPTEIERHQAVVATQRELAKAKAVWAKFAKDLAADPGAPFPTFPAIDQSPDSDAPYETLSPVERRIVDARNA